MPVPANPAPPTPEVIGTRRAVSGSVPNPFTTPAQPRYRMLSRLLPLALLALTSLACTAPDGDASGSSGECRPVTGAHQLADESGSGAGYPWVFFREEAGGWEAVVSLEGHPGHDYRVTLAAHTLELEPLVLSASKDWSDGIDYSSSSWRHISLERMGNCLTGKGTARVYGTSGGFEQDNEAGNEWLDLRLASPEPASLETPMSSSLPWEPIHIWSSRPTPSLAEHLAMPSEDWTASDPDTAPLDGTSRATLQFSGDWDEIQGKSPLFSILPTLKDLSGLAFEDSQTKLNIAEIGEALAEHSPVHWAKLLFSGGTKTHYEGIALLNRCSDYNRVVGQLDTSDKQEAVLELRLVSQSSEYLSPTSWQIHLFAPDGSELPAPEGAQWPSQDSQQWVVDVSGHAKLGFIIEASYEGSPELEECIPRANGLLVEKIFSR